MKILRVLIKDFENKEEYEKLTDLKAKHILI
jgi:hypothetical protein